MNILAALRRWIRELYICLRQYLAIRRISKKETKLIVVFTPGYECRAGGVISIVAIYEESVRLREIHRAGVVLCSSPGYRPFLRYKWFKNDSMIIKWRSVVKRFSNLTSLTIHVPELMIDKIALMLRTEDPEWIGNIKNVHINILLQHIGLFRQQNIDLLRHYGNLTCTTAHRAYCNQELRQALNVKMHHLSWWVNSSQYKRTDHIDKEDLMIVSHDKHRKKYKVLDKIQAACPKLKIVIIQDLSYEEYKKLAHRAKWSITFGEGFDNYFIEPVLCGAVSFAVYNSDFFGPEFPALSTVYSSWDHLEASIVSDLRALDHKAAYDAYAARVYDVVSSMFSPGAFSGNLRQFYLSNYTLS